jgi:hypothetical protein
MTSLDFRASATQRRLDEDVQQTDAAEAEEAQADFGTLIGLPPARARPGEDIEGQRRPKRKHALRKATLVSAEYLKARYGHPIETMLQMASIPVEELAARLQISLHEAWIERRLLLAMAAPYLVPRMPSTAVVVPTTGVDINILEANLGKIFAGPPPAPGEGGSDGESYPGMAPGSNGFDDPQLKGRIEREAPKVFDGQIIEHEPVAEKSTETAMEAFSDLPLFGDEAAESTQ